MEWLPLIASGLAGALVAGVGCAWNSRRHLRGLRNRLDAVEGCDAGLEKARAALARRNGPSARERDAYHDVLQALDDITSYLNVHIAEDDNITRSRIELLSKADRALVRVKIDGSESVHYFAVETIQAFDAYTSTVFDGQPIEAFRRMFFDGQSAVRDLVDIQARRAVTEGT